MAEAKHGRRPMVIEESPGKKAYCRYGISAKVPYCDGAHARENTGVGPVVCAVEAVGTKAICRCLRSGTLPWCDGTHGEL